MSGENLSRSTGGPPVPISWAPVSGGIYLGAHVLFLCAYGLLATHGVFRDAGDVMVAALPWLLTNFVVFGALSGSMPRAANVCLVLALSWLVGCWLLVSYWVPTLEQLDALKGVDAARYHFRAIELVEGHFDTAAVSGGLAFQGVLFYFAAVMWIFGTGFLSVVVANFLLLVLTVWLVLRLAQRIDLLAPRHRWRLSLVALVPELIWFGVLPGKDFVVAIFGTWLFLATVEIFIERGRRFPVGGALLALAGLVGVLVIRPSFLLVFGVAFLAMALVARGLPFILKWWPVLVLVLVGVSAFSQAFSQYTKANRKAQGLIEYSERHFSIEQRQKLLEKHDDAFSDQGLGSVIIPANPLEAVLLAPLRLVAYVVAPLKGLFVPAGESPYLVAQRVCAGMTSLFMVVVLAVLVLRRGSLRRLAPLARHCLVFSVVALFVIANAILLLHPRYRVFMIPEFFLFAILFMTGHAGEQGREAG